MVDGEGRFFDVIKYAGEGFFAGRYLLCHASVYFGCVGSVNVEVQNEVACWAGELERLLE